MEKDIITDNYREELSCPGCGRLYKRNQWICRKCEECKQCCNCTIPDPVKGEEFIKEVLHGSM